MPTAEINRFILHAHHFPPHRDPTKGGRRHPGASPFNTKQGYIKGWWGEAWTLLVACSEKQATNYPGGHGAVIDALLPHCDTQGMTKEKLVELRNDMLAQHKI